MSQSKLWVVIGATGTGKTALSLNLAERLAAEGRPSEIVNADAMQLYRGMNIGTAKLPQADRRGIAHHLFDELEISEEATVAWYQLAARSVISQIHGRGRDAILVGGSGLYVSSAIFDFRFPPRDEALRSELEQQSQEHGVAPLLERLRDLNPKVADSIDTQNPRRVVRALEISLLGKDSNVSLPEAPKLWLKPTSLIGVRSERKQLVERLDARVEAMWREGMLAEVEALVNNETKWGKTASRAIGYAQALAQLHGELDEREAITQTQALTRRYARRQVSWFNRYDSVYWLESNEAVQADGASIVVDQFLLR